MRDHSVHGEFPVSKAQGLVTLESLVGRSNFVAERLGGNHAAGKLARQRMASEKALGRVGEGFAGAKDSAAVGRDEAVTASQAICRGQPRYAGDGGKARGDELASRDAAHLPSEELVTRPVIIARVRLQNPARAIMAT